MDFYLPLIIFCFSTTITPGPNNLMIMMSGSKFGVKSSLPHYLGICIGFALMVALVGLGLGEIFTRWPILHWIIKYVGAFYMLYLAWQIIRSTSELKTVSAKSKPLNFVQALLFQWINPKAWIMAVGAISAYSVVNSSMLSQALIIAGVYFIVGLPCIGMWLIGGVGVSRYLKHPKHLHYFNLTMGTLLILSILLMFLEGH